MAQWDETLEAWLSSLSDGGVQQLSEVLEHEHGPFESVVENIIGSNVIGRPAKAIERWLERIGEKFVIDYENPVSVGVATLGAAVRSDKKEEYIGNIMKLDQMYQETLMILIEEFRHKVKSGEAAQLKEILDERDTALSKLRKQAEQSQHEDKEEAHSSSRSGDADSEELREAQSQIRELERRAKRAEALAEEREDELNESREHSTSTIRNLERKLSESRDLLRNMTDELDLAKAKAAELRKAELRIKKLTKAVEEASEFKAEARELRDVLDRKVEKAFKKDSPALLQSQLDALIQEKEELQKELARFRADNCNLKEELKDTNAKRESAEEQAKLLKEKLEVSKNFIEELESKLNDDHESLEGLDELLDPQKRTSRASADTAGGSSAALQEQVGSLTQQVSATTLGEGDASAKPGSKQATDLEAKLEQEIASRKKLESDKAKLEAGMKEFCQSYEAKIAGEKLKSKEEKRRLETQIVELKTKEANFNLILKEEEERQKTELKLMASASYDVGLRIMRETALRKNTNQGSRSSWLEKSRSKVG
mmetsp:Transcript_22595/g.42288  ORF Transcript_22595/g.42288 Transcript_22595/m.42288 type:complete len:542 (-) Transcript_22595:1311-2936(-)